MCQNIQHSCRIYLGRQAGRLYCDQPWRPLCACHYGGDEFIIVLPDASQVVKRERAKRLCEHIRHANIQFEGQTLEAATLSVGVAVSPENGTTSVEILKAADTALYRAKREGQDRVIVASQ